MIPLYRTLVRGVSPFYQHYEKHQGGTYPHKRPNTILIPKEGVGISSSHEMPDRDTESGDQDMGKKPRESSVGASISAGQGHLVTVPNHVNSRKRNEREEW